MYTLVIQDDVDKIFSKLKKKDVERLKAIEKKIMQILEHPYHFKPLKKPLHNIRRVHIDSSFVLAYTIDEAKKQVIILGFDHHDKIYKHGLVVVKPAEA